VRLATRLLDLAGGVGLVEFQDGVLDGIAVPAGGTVASTVFLFLLGVDVDGEVSIILFIVVQVRVRVRVVMCWFPDTAAGTGVGTRVDTRGGTRPLLEEFSILSPQLDRGTTRVVGRLFRGRSHHWSLCGKRIQDSSGVGDILDLDVGTRSGAGAGAGVGSRVGRGGGGGETVAEVEDGVAAAAGFQGLDVVVFFVGGVG
jgi:hypothetical protein